MVLRQECLLQHIPCIANTFPSLMLEEINFSLPEIHNYLSHNNLRYT